MKESLEKVRAALPEARRSEFDESLKTLAFANVNDLGDLAVLAQTGGLEQAAKQHMEGKTGLEIIAEGHRVEAEKRERQKKAEEERKERQRQETLSEIKMLRAKLDAEMPDVLSKLVIERSRFGEKESGFIREKAIELAVHNNTGHAISHAYFQAVLLTPGREVPWVDSTFNYEISGGLESGESAIWNLRPNMFGEWGKAPADRDDMIFIVRPTRLEGADGKSLAGEQFSNEDEKRLQDLLDSVHYENEVQLKAKLDARTKAILNWRETATVDAAKSERDYLTKMKSEAALAQSSIAKFIVEKARFYFSETGFTSQPVIDVTVRNNTGQTVSRFYAHGVLSSPGRETPWVDEDFNYSIRGGIKPGEAQSFELSPNMFSEWGKVPKDRGDIVLTATIKRIDGADGKELFEAEFPEKSATRLAALEKMIESRGWK
jgi:hypothetical protein